MKALLRYFAALVGVVALTAAVAMPFLDGPDRTALAGAAMLTVSLQVVLFEALRRARQEDRGFLLWWGGGMLGRMALVALVGIGVRVLGAPAAETLVLSTAGFLFVFLLLEAAFLARDRGDPEYAR